ncbi:MULTISPECIES: 16S rRNA (cytidine(1402)-2'-O)-methyltransferase [unclassified Siphonobacter]|uniref:16S rRNA (cytidine(1402)-2'-O)-methyltransferase n=1 Tax=unclassified Siphonobacter TaxID=2635712 RepID=UPI000CBF8CE0|nr:MULTISPECIES: 16S rRNA (cytidine(1402)-2'-O)-methyltransferase [unclassified Siphonobacter]MDQ1089620.1 16S rRNA (cytidine1402-2'-O)-methyltransferase [Siphonobacter sp. SORGH_AS_1065]MDR6195869.1 16S rRNA (cytidine1402-2'-O)-methyltransferase [Siphonobacter sp. SORGH_AS_0500]PKK37379.1 16S rRNA (cytidine(1402)-2'-O)-methyltransferase [Siphonobacter sp. SORGH_AS_0500]
MKLYLVPTPIGNLDDITLRALKVLQSVDAILAEDTRTTGQLLKHLNIQKPLMAHHSHNEHASSGGVIKMLQSGKTLALVSDAGTPGISDPGFLLVRECLKNGLDVECLPGPTAFVPALVNSGLPTDRFCFEGFLPQKKGRQTRLKALVEEERTMVFYESPHRIVKLLEQLVEVVGPDRQASVSRELTKMFEETVRGTLTELIQHYTDHADRVKGEFVLVVAGA